MERRSPHPPQQQQLQARLPAPRSSRATSRPGPSSTGHSNPDGARPGAFAHGYPGPDRPYPEFRRRSPRAENVHRPAPRSARAAGILGIVGALPLALFVGAAVGLGGLSGDDAVEWWLYPLLAAPVAQLWGAIELLSGRSWRLLVLTCLPATALFGYLLYVLAAESDRFGLGYYTLVLVLPVPALVLATLPSVRQWVHGRKRARAASRAPR